MKSKACSEDMESRANPLHDFEALFMWDVKLGQDHGETNLMSLQLGVMPCLQEDLIIVSLMVHGSLGACVDARVENLDSTNSNPRMDM
jgi:hypothetical protein